MTVRLAVTLGDPRGIGPEVVRKAAASLADEAPDVTLRILGDPGPHEVDYPFPVQATGSFDGSLASAGRVAGAAIEEAVRLALAGEVDGVVTAPIHKPAMQAAGYDEPGHTELLQRLTGAADVGMLMAAERTRLDGPLRVLLATTHLPLREVPDRVDGDLLRRQIRLLAASMESGWDLHPPRIAVCGLNPHASDDGLFGNEEESVFAPALSALAEEGLAVTGPVPADTVFGRAIAGEFDAVVAPYHDVGMAAFKTVSFGGGVNVTLGLPFPRTSPDHGTAFDLAGRDAADPSSTLEALRVAARLAGSGRG